ncbi:hypothetical protein R1sor_005972 [Riccia sorocarpa]|uniref:NB-ARC domain-containing protein n=1 Tax=Riccia sorocarpa TaxID=122646 RepID=A0ABD3HQB0_9MARC
MVLKKIALCAESSANQERSGRSLSRQYETFLRNVEGALFLSTPSLGANVPVTNLGNQGGLLLKNLELLGAESARINAEFSKLRRRWKWMTYGVFAANETETTKFLQHFFDIGGSDSELDSAPRYVSIVPEGSARTDMDEFSVISGVDHFTICQSSESYICLVELENVDRSQKRQLERLVAQNLLYSSGRRVGIDEGQQPWVHIRGKKVLMVVDDVNSKHEISQLLRMDWCGGGSRLIITSSRQDWRREFTVYQVPFLSGRSSYDLLASYVDKSVLKSIPEEVMSKVVEECGGLPLVLEVIGNYLWDKKEVRIWLEALKRLQKADSLEGNADENVILKKLQVSFDSLGKLEKQIFLDVATFDLYPTCKTQYDVEIFRSAWETQGNEDVEIALINLEQRSFLSVVANCSRYTVHVHGPHAKVQVFWIHKQMQAMARWISGSAEENLEDRRSIWQLQNAADLLTNCDKVSDLYFGI